MTIARFVQLGSVCLLIFALCACGTQSVPDETVDSLATGWFTMERITMERNYSGQCLTAASNSSGSYKYVYMTGCRNSSDQVFKITDRNQLTNRKFGGLVAGSKGGGLYVSNVVIDPGTTVQREQSGSFSRFKFPRLGNYCIYNASTKGCTGTYGEYWRLKNPGY